MNEMINCDQILENSSKSHMYSHVAILQPCAVSERPALIISSMLTVSVQRSEKDWNFATYTDISDDALDTPPFMLNGHLSSVGAHLQRARWPYVCAVVFTEYGVSKDKYIARIERLWRQMSYLHMPSYFTP